MRIDIITLLPELLESPFRHSILKRAQGERGAWKWLSTISGNLAWVSTIS